MEVDLVGGVLGGSYDLEGCEGVIVDCGLLQEGRL